MDNVDQASGLRRILFGSKSRFITFLSALGNEEKSATLVNLSTGLGRLGNDVLLLDMQKSANSVTHWLGTEAHTTLADVATIEEAVQVTMQGFKLVRFCGDDSTSSKKLNHLVEELGKSVDIVLVDGELSEVGGLMVTTLEEGDIVILVTNHPDSIKEAYSLIKRAHGQFGRRSYGVLVTGVNEEEAQRVYDAMAQAADNFLSVALTFMGYVPQDDYLRRANMSGITVLDAFPMAGASKAFSRLAQQMLHV